MKKNAIIAAVLILIGAGPCRPGLAAEFDHAIFDQVLKSYVNPRGLVDYNGIAADQSFPIYMQSLEAAQPEAMSRDGQLAFWINAYNAVTIDKVIKWKPKKSVRETFVPGVWTGTKFFTSREHTVAGRSLSPDDIEHDILRKRLKDFRIHFAIICASSSCPQLPRFAYTAENVQAGLEAETRRYINSDRGTQIDAAQNTLYLSKLFDWFAGDFESTSGSIQNFMKPYLDAKTLEFWAQGSKIKFLHYDWSLNAQAPLR